MSINRQVTYEFLFILFLFMGLKEFRTLRIKKEENKELGKERLKGCRRDREEKGGTNLNRGKDRKHMKENLKENSWYTLKERLTYSWFSLLL